MEESDEIIKFINRTRTDVITSLTIAEILEAQKLAITINQAKLQKAVTRVIFSFTVK